MRISWVSGWGLPVWYLEELVNRFYPQHSHRIILPEKSFFEALSREHSDVIVGYSFGAYLLLKEGIHFREAQLKFLAPIIDLRKEKSKGGNVSETQLNWLKRGLKRNPIEMLNDFYERAGLGLEINELPYCEEDLIWGIDQLMKSLDVDCMGEACVGSCDALLNTDTLSKFIPRLKIIPHGTHAPETLFSGIRFDEI